jgi:cytochrome c-type biogenesis protein CcmE
MKKKRIYYALGAVLLLVFAGFSFSEFKESLTPYVPYEVALESQRTVQVAGGLAQGSSAYDTEDQFLRFTLVDQETAQTLRVRYHGVKPANFEDAVSIVAIGRYDAAASEFAADKLLVKCPSKYQGIEDTETKTYS